MTQLIEFFSYDFKTSTFFQNDSNNWTFLNMTRWIELFFRYDPKNFFCWMWFKELNLFFWMCFKEFFHKILLSIEPFLKYDAQNRTLLFNITQRIEPFFELLLKNSTLFKIWLEELNIFSIELFQCDLRIFFEKKNFDLKNWNFFWSDLKNWLFWKMSQIIEPIFEHYSLIHRIEFFFDKIWLKEFNFFFQHHSKIEPTFLNLIQRIELFMQRNMTQRIEQWVEKKASNKWNSFFLIWLK